MQSRIAMKARTFRHLLAAAAASFLLSGCVSLVIGAVGVAADVAVGAVKLTGKAVGAAVDVVTPGSSDEKK